ncbi:helix-turn-helix transcriptional regulator [Nonomuraea africana]|uniref:helix-turn-helix transcriptional regulator n=1 Tax=Nonomuraea africana TaxID=46171 RepID=UPI003CD0BFE7
MEERHLTTRQLAKRLGVPLRTVYYWNSIGRAPRRIAVGREVHYKLSDVEAWEDERYV